jgi:flagellin
MSLVVNHNLMAMNAARNLSATYGRLAESTQRLSSGMRVNSAADDAAGLAIREIMRAEIAVLNQGIRNASDAISMIQTAEGAMSVIDEKLIRMKELAEQAATGTYTTAQREIINSEYQAMAAEIDRIATATDFNGVKLLDGSLRESHGGSGLKIHFGTGNSADEDYYYVQIGDMRATKGTGLRVGNSDLRDTLRTTALNVNSPDDVMQDTASSTDGLFGIRYSSDFDSESPGSATWDVYGYVNVDASRDSLNSIVADINKGRQATGTLTMTQLSGGGSATDDISTQSLTINGQIFTFATGSGTGTYNGTLGTGVVNLTTTNYSATSVAWDTTAFLNEHSASIGVRAVSDGATLHLFAAEWGEDGNSIETVSGTTAMVMGQKNLEHGGEEFMTSSVYYDENNEEYELQLQMNHGGEDYQLQIFNLTTLNGTSDIVGGTIAGTSMGGTWGGVLPINDDPTSVLPTYGSTDEESEWIQAQNGTGNTDWDGADILTQSAAQKALAGIDLAIRKKDTARANLGAIQNRLENTITNLQIQAENLQAAESRISDVDVATEMTQFTRNNILAQAATAMLAQANSLPQLALQLLGG